MELKLIFLYNILSAFGVLLLIFGHTYISVSNIKKGFLLAAIGSLIVAVVSYFLQSYPVMLLNIVWSIISVYGYFHYEKSKKIRDTKKYSWWIFSILVAISGLFIFIYMKTNNNDYLAYNCTFIYLFTYFLFSLKFISKRGYLFWGIIGYFFVIFHLFDKFQYSVLINETIGVIIGLTGLTKIYLENKNNFISLNEKND